MRRFVITLTIFVLGIASAATSYRVTLYQPTTVNGTEFKPGECKLELKDNQAILKQGKRTAEATVKIETSKDKFGATSVGYTNGNQIQEIRLGDTNKKLLFGAESETDVRATR